VASGYEFALRSVDIHDVAFGELFFSFDARNGSGENPQVAAFE
jgi:hypothetical protein